MTKSSSDPAVEPLFAAPGTTAQIEQGTIFTPKFDENGLLAAVATDAATGEVLMLAWMNAEALEQTIETGIAHFWSRSRNKLWRKGETSGNLLRIVELRTDCDQDALWMRVDIAGDGVACHTGAPSCFYREIPLRSAKGTALRFIKPAGTAKTPE